ncbi:MAG: hypothetical protein O8C65_11200, partial [Candidatus Methanoperedens sp.]|nr:hypothetical protein [Candidatus Methanoperedens sp.]
GGKHIFNGGSSPNSVEYDINFPSVGSYNLEIKYAAEWSRPEDIYLDNVKVIDNGIASSTGSWYLSSGIWEKQGTLTITTSGIHTLKIVADNTCCFPHIDAIRLTNSINNVFWSGKYTSNIETKNYINLKGVNSATLEYKINYSVSSYYQEAKRKICDSTDVCSVSIFYGKQPWTTHKIDLSSYIGKEIKILFFNLPYSNGGNGGLYIDDITVTTDKGVVFNDTADNFANWNNNGFSVVPKIT